jgi:hypothetical protein
MKLHKLLLPSLLLLGACEALEEKPISPAVLLGDWRCERDLQISFQAGNKYSMANPTGTRFGTYSVRTAERNINELKLVQDKSIAEKPHDFPEKFRFYPKTPKQARDALFFYGDGWEPFHCEKVK